MATIALGQDGAFEQLDETSFGRGEKIQAVYRPILL
ncbi:hypothetical protein P308_15800 [Pseudomonas piscis]|nr:hypothetical protein P308_15800 [Pseudomonas piscis]